MATTGERLIELDRKFWMGDAAFFAGNLDDACLVAFTRMSGLRRREEIVAAMQGRGLRWREVELTLRGCVEPGPGVAIVTYHAMAIRPDGQRYAALASSGYADRDGTWKLTFHHQTPLT